MTVLLDWHDQGPLDWKECCSAWSRSMPGSPARTQEVPLAGGKGLPLTQV
jgi:hypothetical protein